MKARIHFARGVSFLILLTFIPFVTAGDLDPSAPPGSTMKPLDEVEPRTAIHQSDVPLTIDTPGSYYLAENITYTDGYSTCIIISSNDVTVDLSGFTINAPSPKEYGIFINIRRNVEIRNGTILGFDNGVYGIDGGGENYRVLNINVRDFAKQGIYLDDCDTCRIENCVVSDGGTDSSGSSYFSAISVGINSVVSGCSVYKFGDGAAANFNYGIRTSSNCKVVGNRVYDNLASAGGYNAYGVYTGGGCVVQENVIYQNGAGANGDVFGMYLSGSSTVNHNTLHNNGDSGHGSVYGMYASSGCSVNNNTAFSNGTYADRNVYGIFGYHGCTVNGNSVYSNGGSASGTNVFGIYASSGTVVIGNIARSNGTNASGNVYGIYLYGYAVVNNNTAYNNSGTSGGTNMNIVSSCSYGTNCAP